MYPKRTTHASTMKYEIFYASPARIGHHLGIFYWLINYAANRQQAEELSEHNWSA